MLADARLTDNLPPLRLGVITERHSPPYSWSSRCEPDAPRGLSLDVPLKVFSKLGIDYQIEGIHADSNGQNISRQKLADGAFDATLLVGNKAEERFTVVPEPVLSLSTSVFIRKSDWQRFSTTESLRDQRGIYVTKTATAVMKALAARHPQSLNRLESHPHLKTIVDMMLDGEVQYFITERSAGSAYLAELGMDEQIVRSELPLGMTFYVHLFLSKESPYVNRVDDFSETLKELYSSGEVALLLRKNMLQWLSVTYEGCEAG